MKSWQAVVSLIHSAHSHKTKRTIDLEAPTLEAAEALVPSLATKGGYAGYRLSKIISLTEVGS